MEGRDVPDLCLMLHLGNQTIIKEGEPDGELERTEYGGALKKTGSY